MQILREIWGVLGLPVVRNTLIVVVSLWGTFTYYQYTVGLWVRTISLTHSLTHSHKLTYSRIHPFSHSFFHSFITHLFTRLLTDIGDIGSCVSACSDRLFLVLESLVQYHIQASIAARDTSNPYISSYSWTFWYALMY